MEIVVVSLTRQWISRANYILLLAQLYADVVYHRFTGVL